MLKISICKKINNYLLIHDVGAYGAVMASNYNSRGIPAEILVNQNKFFRMEVRKSVRHLPKNKMQIYHYYL